MGEYGLAGWGGLAASPPGCLAIVSPWIAAAEQAVEQTLLVDSTETPNPKPETPNTGSPTDNACVDMTVGGHKGERSRTGAPNNQSKLILAVEF